MKILFIGDICGKIGRKTVAKILPKLKKKLKPDLIIANAENAAHGSGVTEKTLEELLKSGIDFFTGGDHSFDKLKQFDCYKRFSIIRPANFPPEVAGEGYKIIEIKNTKILIINLIGRIFMKKNYDCPFRKADEILTNFKESIKFAIIDIHAETASEKINLARYLDGRVSAILGTHTHVMTADEQISPKGTAYISDTGMVGYKDGSIGIEHEGTIKTFLTQIRHPHVIPQKGKTIFNAVFIELNEKTGKTEKIKSIKEFTEIK